MTDYLSVPVRYPSAALYALLAKQIPGYQKRYGLGQSSSVPSETAGELLRGLLYCLEQAPCDDPAEALTAGKAVLLTKQEQAAQLCRLVRATAPEPENRCRWDTAARLERWIKGYDYGNAAQFRLRASADFLPPLLSSENGKYIQYSAIFRALIGDKISR